MSLNSIYVRRRRRIYVQEGEASLPVAFVATLQKNIEPLGFRLSETAAHRIQTLSVEKLGTFYKTFAKDLHEMVGAHREFRPMYPDFPQQVMEMSEAQLYWNAILHYLTNQLPGYAKTARPALNEQTELRIIDLGSKEDFESIFPLLASARTSLAAHDKDDLAWFVAQYGNDIMRMVPVEIPHKENLAFLGAQLLRYTTAGKSFVAEKIKTATDVLRLAVAMSGGDVSLALPCKFLKFRRGERKSLLSFLERCGDPTEDMLRWKERWKRLGECLHPGDYALIFPKTYAAFATLRKNHPYTTFNGRIEKCLLTKDAAGVMELLQGRPGDLARRLDHLLRFGGDSVGVLASFRGLADRVSTPVLLQVRTHFASRQRGDELRTFFPKGEVSKVYAVHNKLPPLAPGICDEAVKCCEDALIRRFSKLPPLGRCYLDPALENYGVPFSQRSASKSLRTLVRGSRLPLPDGSTLRFFIWWKNGRSRVDIDLSAAFYDSAFKYVNVVSYYNLKNFGGRHSGDIVDAPHGAAEFIDLDIARTVSAGVRYVVMCLNSFTEQPYCELPECFAGWMSRKDPNSGEVFEPRTVQDRVDVASDTRICIPAIFDLEERRVVWTDIALRKGPSWNNVRNNLSGVSLMLRAMLSLRKTDLKTLFDLHIKARGELVADKGFAEHVFSVDDGLTPFDLDRIASEFM